MAHQTRSRPRLERARRLGAPLGNNASAWSPRARLKQLTAGGTDGNERLTMSTGLLLIVLFAVLGVTIVRIGQLLWLHLFLGLVLLGPVALKLMSTGYRFARYYTSNPAYRRKGPPALLLRALGPMVVTLTLAVFATGIALLLLGPSSRQPLVLLHKVSFIAWIALVALHVLGHLPETSRYLRTAAISRRQTIAMRSRSHAPGPRAAAGRLPGRGGRAASLVAALVGGLALAVALVPLFAAWSH